jgi:hypothetical protein
MEPIDIGTLPTMRLRIRSMVAAGALIGAIAVIGVPQAASAAAYQPIKRGSKCMFLTGSASDYTGLTLGTCGLVGSSLQRISAGKYNGHDAIIIQWPWTNPICVDSLAQTSGRVNVHECNGGNYQWFEVFNGSVSGTKVLKSIGAWEHQHLHRCISASNTAGAKMTWATCNTASSAQQFKFA